MQRLADAHTSTPRPHLELLGHRPLLRQPSANVALTKRVWCRIGAGADSQVSHVVRKAAARQPHSMAFKHAHAHAPTTPAVATRNRVATRYLMVCNGVRIMAEAGRCLVGVLDGPVDVAWTTAEPGRVDVNGRCSPETAGAVVGGTAVAATAAGPVRQKRTNNVGVVHTRSSCARSRGLATAKGPCGSQPFPTTHSGVQRQRTGYGATGRP